MCILLYSNPVFLSIVHITYTDHIFRGSTLWGQGFWDSGVLVGENHKNSFLRKVSCNTIDAQFYKGFTQFLHLQVFLIYP